MRKWRHFAFSFRSASVCRPAQKAGASRRENGIFLSSPLSFPAICSPACGLKNNSLPMKINFREQGIMKKGSFCVKTYRLILIFVIILTMNHAGRSFSAFATSFSNRHFVRITAIGLITRQLRPSPRSVLSLIYGCPSGASGSSGIALPCLYCCLVPFGYIRCKGSHTSFALHRRGRWTSTVRGRRSWSG